MLKAENIRKKFDSLQVLKGVDVESQPLEQIVRLALKNMMKG